MGEIPRRRFLVAAGAFLAAPLAAQAQPPRVYRVGVVLLGGPYSAAINGLRDGLKELGLEEGRQLILHVRDVRSDPLAIEAAARHLEAEKVDLIYSVTTSASIAVKRVTRSVPIVFYAGNDPVASGLVESLRKPGGRITGIHSRQTLLMAKRIELLKEMIPDLRRVLIYYSPNNPIGRQSVQIARDAARQLGVELIERSVASVEELRASLDALRPGEVDALTYVDAMVVSQTEKIIEISKAKKLPIVMADQASVAKGILASYGVDYYTMGRLAARYVHRILLGTSPAELPVEQVDRFGLVINLKTAQSLGITIPRAVLARTDEVIK
jgi:putative ABC transport system substrate-binding protein